MVRLKIKTSDLKFSYTKFMSGRPQILKKNVLETIGILYQVALVVRRRYLGREFDP